jgi:hypothetical protein
MLSQYQLRDFELRVRIRRCIDEEWLPVFLPDSITAGYGSGSKCYACDQPIVSSEIKYDVQEPRNAARLRFHLGCYVLWQSECVKRMRAEHQDSVLVSLFAYTGSSKEDPGGNGRARKTRPS